MLCFACDIMDFSSSFSLSEHSAFSKPSSISHLRRKKQAAITAIVMGVVTSQSVVWVVRITKCVCSAVVRHSRALGNVNLKMKSKRAIFS